MRQVKVEDQAVSSEVLEAVLRHPGLRTLDLSLTDLSSVEPGLPARLLHRLEEVDMWSTELTRQQLEAVLTAAEASCTLRKLNLGNNNLSLVEPGLLARAVNSLEEVDIRHTLLTKEQVEAILSQSLVQTSLKRLVMGRFTGGVEEDLVVRAQSVIKELSLCYVM